MKSLIRILLAVAIVGSCQNSWAQLTNHFRIVEPIPERTVRKNETVERPSFEVSAVADQFSSDSRPITSGSRLMIARRIPNANSARDVIVPVLTIPQDRSGSSPEHQVAIGSSRQQADSFHYLSPGHFYRPETSSWASESGWGKITPIAEASRPSFVYFEPSSCDIWQDFCKTSCCGDQCGCGHGCRLGCKKWSAGCGHSGCGHDGCGHAGCLRRHFFRSGTWQDVVQE